MSKRGLVPMSHELYALLARARVKDPPASPSAARARVREGVLNRLAKESRGVAATDAALEPLEPGPAGSTRVIGRALRSPRAAPWIAGLCAAAATGALVTRALVRREPTQERTSAVQIPTAPRRELSLDDDPANCGRPGHDCCGGACERGVCQPLVVTQSYHPGKLTVDDAHVYWPEGHDGWGRIMKAPKRGGDAVVLAAGQRRPWAVAVYAGYAYWVENSDVAPNYGGVSRVSIAGGEVTRVVARGEAEAGSIVVNEAGVFWDDYGEYASHEVTSAVDRCVQGARVRKVGLDDWHPVTLAAPSSGVCTPLFMAADAHHVYWPSRFRRTIQRVGVDGGAATVVAQASDPFAVALAAPYVYWVNWADGTVQRAPVEGGDALTVATSGEKPGPKGGVGGVDLVVDATTVYWVRQGPPEGVEGAVLHAAVAGPYGGMGTVLATSPSPGAIAMDEACVYWTDSGDGKIRVVAKP
jgi:hypothetical protein